MILVYIFMTALFSSLLLVPMLRWWAVQSGALDHPDPRKVHTGAIPRLGGVAIFIAFLFSLLVHTEITPHIRGILCGSLVVFVTGLVDDLSGLSVKKKFVGQVAACVVTIGIGRIYLTNLGDLFGTGNIVLPTWLGILFTIFAVVGVINAINLIDGLDGLAGGIAVIALGAFTLLGRTHGNPEATLVSVALLGSLLGFLRYNSYPACIFMGDVGSLTIGFTLAFLAVDLTQFSAMPLSPVIPVIILGLPILDTLWVMGSRVATGLNPFSPDRTHVHHKFLNLGFQHRFTVLFIYGISLFWVLFCFLFIDAPDALLFWGYLAISGGSYLTLRYFLRRPDRFPFMARDSMRSLTDSATYQRLSESSWWVEPILKVVLGAYFLLGVFAFRHSGEGATQLALLILVVGLSLLVATRDPFNHYFLLVLYLAGLLIVAQSEMACSRIAFGALNCCELLNALFGVMGLLVLLRIVLRRGKDFILTEPLDFLVLALSLCLAVIPHHLSLPFNLASVTAEAVILFLAFKVIVNDNPRSSRLVYWGVQAALLVIVLRGVV